MPAGKGSPVQKQPRSALLQVYKDKEVFMMYLGRRGGRITLSHFGFDSMFTLFSYLLSFAYLK